MKNRFLSIFFVAMLLLSVSPILTGAQINNIGNVTDTEGNSTIIWNLPTDIVYGTDLSGVLNAYAVDNTNVEIPETDSIITYSRLNGTVNETISPSTILNVGSHTLYAVFNPSSIEIMNNGRQVCTVSITLNVTKATPNIVWDNPADVLVGAPITETQLNAVAKDVNNNTVAGNYTYTPLNGTVLAVGNNQPLTVNFIPDDQVNFNNNSKTVYVNVKADKTMVASFSGTPVNGSAPLTVLFADQSTGSPTSRLWLFGDGGYSVTPGNTINHTYTKNGLYDVTLFVFNETTFSQVQKMKYINVGNVQDNVNNSTNYGIISTNSSKWLIINDIWADQNSGTAPYGTTFHCNISATRPICTYNWTFEPAGDDYYSKSGPDASHTYKHEGVFNVTLRVKDKCGNTASFTKLAYIVVLPATESGEDREESISDDSDDSSSSVNDKPKTSSITITNKKIKSDAEFNWWSASLQRGTTVRFTTDNTDASTVSWCFGDGTSAAGRVVDHTYSKIGSYTVTQIIKYGNNHNTAVTKVITIN